MKKIIIFVVVIVAIVASVGGAVGLYFSDLKTVAFADTDEVLLNPGKGFVDYGNALFNGGRDYITVGYHRFNWADLEEVEGEINFAKIDDWLDTYVKRGKKFAFGVMCVNTSSSKEYITPKYVFDKGAKSYDALLDGGTYQKVPDWKDEIYLSCVNKFVAALGARYNGNKNIAFVDILSYGNWGEQHLFHLDVDDPDYMKNQKITPGFLKEKYVKPYMEAFPDTLLFNPWGEKDFNDVYLELVDEGVSLRRDGIVSYTNGLDILAKCYGKLPVVFEYAGNYDDYIPDREQYFNQRLQEAINIAKPSYIELDLDWFNNNKDYCAELANKMGYYFRLKKAQYRKNISRSKKSTIKLTFANDGIAPIYENCLVYIGLLDKDGNLVEKYLTDLNPKTWLPNRQVTQSVSVLFGKKIKTGNYTLAVGLFENATDEKPTYLLGSEGKNADNWYLLGDVKIKK